MFVFTHLLISYSYFILTNQLTPWSRALLQELTIPRLVKKFPAIYGTGNSITTFTSRYPESSRDPMLSFVTRGFYTVMRF